MWNNYIILFTGKTCSPVQESFSTTDFGINVTVDGNSHFVDDMHGTLSEASFTEFRENV